MDVAPLKELSIFDNFPPRSLNAMAGVMVMRSWREGEALIVQENPSDGIYLILDGKVQITRVTASGATVVLNTMQKGAVIGTLSTIDGGVRGANCIAKTDVQAAFLTQADCLELMQGGSPLALGFQLVMLRSIFADIRRTNSELAELSSLQQINEVHQLPS